MAFSGEEFQTNLDEIARLYAVMNAGQQGTVTNQLLADQQTLANTTANALALLENPEDKTALMQWIQEQDNPAATLVQLEAALGSEFTDSILPTLRSAGLLSPELYAEFRAASIETFLTAAQASTTTNELGETQVFREDGRYWGTLNQETYTNIASEFDNPFIAEAFAQQMVANHTPEEMVAMLDTLQPGALLHLLQSDAFLTALYNEGPDTHAHFTQLQEYIAEGGPLITRIAEFQTGAINQYTGMDEEQWALQQQEWAAGTAGVDAMLFTGITIDETGQVVWPDGRLSPTEQVNAAVQRMEALPAQIQAAHHADLRAEMGPEYIITQMELAQAAMAAGNTDESRDILARLFQRDADGFLAADLDGDNNFGLGDITMLFSYFVDNVINGDMQIQDALGEMGNIFRTALGNRDLVLEEVDLRQEVSGIFSGMQITNTGDFNLDTGVNFDPGTEVNPSEVLEQMDPRYH